MASSASDIGTAFHSDVGQPDIKITGVNSQRFFHVHKIHLIASSPVFAGMFALVPDSSESEINLPDNARVLEIGLKFCYPLPIDFESVSIPDLVEVFTFLDKYQILLGRQLVEKHFWSKSSYCSLYGLELYTLASQHGLKDLAFACKPFAFTQRFKTETCWRERMGVEAVYDLFLYHHTLVQSIEQRKTMQLSQMHRQLGTLLIEDHACHNDRFSQFIYRGTASDAMDSQRPYYKCHQCGYADQKMWIFRDC